MESRTLPKEPIFTSLFWAFNNAQKFCIQLICEYYEEKIDNKNNEIAELKDQVMLLRKENKNMASKVRSASNMVRILSINERNDYETPKTDGRLLKKKFTGMNKRKKSEPIKTKKLASNLKDETSQLREKVPPPQPRERRIPTKGFINKMYTIAEHDENVNLQEVLSPDLNTTYTVE